MKKECSAAVLLAIIISLCVAAKADPLPETIARVKQSIVGVGTYQPTRQPRSQLQGTGFVVGDGYHVITNAHVVAEILSEQKKERRVIFTGSGQDPQVRDVRVLKRDNEHDLALLRITGTRLPPLKLADSGRVREGERYAFTGFPIGAALGLYPATHQGMVSSITPIATPAFYSGRLNPARIKRLKNPYEVFQLDATAYPGNSGSPLYDRVTGEVVGIINKVFVQGAKEAALENPSGITYAIPSQHAISLLGGE